MEFRAPDPNLLQARPDFVHFQKKGVGGAASPIGKSFYRYFWSLRDQAAGHEHWAICEIPHYPVSEGRILRTSEYNLPVSENSLFLIPINKKTMRILTVGLLTLIAATSYAQTTPREQLDPKVTEVWDLKPKKISAGTNVGDAPSDAVILFNGKDLSEWTNLDGGAPKWDVKDGAFTVAKGGGDIKTKKTFGDFQLHIE